jgi:putative iron-regulated protein
VSDLGRARPRRCVRIAASLAVAAAAVTTVAVPATSVLAASAQSTVKGIPAKQARAAAETYADVVHASYDDSVQSATSMKAAIAAFLANPDEATLAAAKQAWLTARDDYLPTEAFRFYDGPIDNPKNGPEGRINAWPMDEAYVDYVTGSPGSGIINNTAEYPTITTAVLTETNEAGGEKNISTGWHAIEFLLWGQDTDPTGPGTRPVTDFTTGTNAARRAEYLRLATDLLIADLTGVRDQWAPDTGAYRKKMVANPKQAITNALRGMGALSAGELAGERMSVAYETKDQEDEHSCFSDNTNADIVGDLVGIRRVYLADHPRVQGGTSLSDLVAKVNPQLDAQLKGQLDESLRLTRAFPAPFEQLIVGADTAPGRQAMMAAINAIEDQGESIAQIAKQFRVKITLEV